MSAAAEAAPPRGDQVRVSVTVAASPDAAFDFFTAEIDAWWRRGPKFRHVGARRGVVHLEPGVGGRLFESIEGEGDRAEGDGTEGEGSGASVFEAGRVTAWEPGRRLAFSWRNVNFAPHEQTEVEVLFVGRDGSTTVTVTHRGWASLPPGHAARHGLAVDAFCRTMGLWWGEQMSALRERLASR